MLRARSLALMISGMALFAPPVVDADYAGEPEPEVFAYSWMGLPEVPGAPYGTIQTAARAGDTLTLQVRVHSLYNPEPTISIDPSVLGTPPATATGTFNGYGDMYHYPSYFHDFPLLLPIPADLPDGVKEIPISVTDGRGSTTTAVARLTVDNALPTLFLASLTFTGAPGDFAHVSLAGSASGTGSAVKVSKITLMLLDGSGHETDPGYASMPYNADMAALGSAFASSTDGSFNVPLDYFGLTSLADPAIASIRLTLVVYDEAGQAATATITAPVPHAPPPPTGHSSVLFLPGTEASRLYYKDLLGLEHQVWEPDKFTDIPYLAMNADGSSKYPLYTKDIVGTMEEHSALESSIASLFGTNLEVYGGFERYMDGLVRDGTLKEWRAYPYDWRYDVRDIVQNGTDTELSGGTVRRVYLINALQEMASSSPTGKVTIVGHSNGGLLAKALAAALGTGASRYIDKIIMIGAPQWGTPSTVGAMLHADNFADVSGMVINSAGARKVEGDMPGAYGILPSASYFAHIADPIATFDPTTSLSWALASRYGASITSAGSLTNYLEDTAGLDASLGSGLRAPVPLRADLINKAAATHAALDAWTPPQGIAVTTIAGWGQDTVKGFTYTTGSRISCALLCTSVPQLQHAPITTQDGDDTVVSPSAIGEVGQKLYFNAARFRDEGKGNFTHQNLTSAAPLQTLVKSIITAIPFDGAPYIGSTKPTNGANPIIRISSHSPVNLVVTDSVGNKSGVVPIPGSDFSGIIQNIPASSMQALDDEQYVNLPAGGSYQVTATGYAEGSATLIVEQIAADGSASPVATYANIPTMPRSTATFTVTNGSPTAPRVDVNGDGITDLIAVAISTSTSPLDYIASIRQTVASLGLAPKIAKQMDLKLANLAHLLKKDEKWEKDDEDGSDDAPKGAKRDARILRKIGKIEAYVQKQAELGQKTGKRGDASQGMTAANAEIILDMINTLKTLKI